MFQNFQSHEYQASRRLEKSKNSQRFWKLDYQRQKLYFKIFKITNLASSSRSERFSKILNSELYDWISRERKSTQVEKLNLTLCLPTYCFRWCLHRVPPPAPTGGRCRHADELSSALPPGWPCTQPQGADRAPPRPAGSAPSEGAPVPPIGPPSCSAEGGPPGRKSTYKPPPGEYDPPSDSPFFARLHVSPMTRWKRGSW